MKTKPKHTTINRLIQETGATKYLEIGYGMGHNFGLIICEEKIGCDPNIKNDFSAKNIHVLKGTSDQLFEHMDKDLKFDIIFIDGDHTAQQVEKDILNAWDHIKIGGLILLHDVDPYTKEMQLVPRIQEQWTGDVWRAYCGFIQKYPQIETRYYPEKYGLGCIVKSRHKIESGFVDYDTTYEEFDKDPEKFLKVDHELFNQYL